MRERLLSLDIFRGITIAGMLVVNNPGSWTHIYPPLRHAEWHGCTPTDLIFPFFLFIVGVAVVIAFSARAAAGEGRSALLRKAAVRSLKLAALGLVLHGFPHYDLAAIRIPGVLQRIALVFLAAAALLLFASLKAQVAACAALLLGYWALLTLVPAPGVIPGALQPGTDLGAFLDRAVFGEAHLWAQSRTWDPEGMLSTLPAIATALTGGFAGHWLSSPGAAGRKAAGLVAAGVAGVLAGLLWHQAFPINKNLWTSSYVLFTSGLACLVLAGCYYLADGRGWRAWGRPFQVFGVNAIAAFFLSSLGARVLGLLRTPDGTPLKTWLFENGFLAFAAPRVASLLFAVAYTAFWLAIMWVLYRRRIFIKV